jgi:hypothetical protein
MKYLFFLLLSSLVNGAVLLDLRNNTSTTTEDKISTTVNYNNGDYYYTYMFNNAYLANEILTSFTLNISNIEYSREISSAVEYDFEPISWFNLEFDNRRNYAMFNIKTPNKPMNGIISANSENFRYEQEAVVPIPEPYDIFLLTIPIFFRRIRA